MIISHFYSDPHFGHSRIIQYANRPFTNVKDMDRYLVEQYNLLVQPNHTVLWCGDCSFRIEQFATIMANLNGRKILIRGNHDKTEAVMSKMGFDLVLNEAVLHIGGRTCRVNHYPYAGSQHARDKRDDRYLDRRPKRVPGEILIHGHTHSQQRRFQNMIHVGVDAWQYRPTSFDEVEALVKEIPA